MIDIQSPCVPAGPNGVQTAPIDIRTPRAATATGVTPDRVERLPFDLSEIDENGAFLVRRVTRG